MASDKKQPAEESKENEVKKGSESARKAEESKENEVKKGSESTNRKRIFHEKLKGQDAVIGKRTVKFDEDGFLSGEVTPEEKARLLSIPGFKEV